MPDITDGLMAPQKTIVIDTKNKALDRIAGNAEDPKVEDPKVEDPKTDGPKDPVEDPKVEDPNGANTEDDPDPKDPIRTIPKDDPVDDPKDDPKDPVEDEEVDLTELAIEVDGKERPVSELLSERDELAKRVAKYDSDPFLKGLLEHYEAHGNIDAYYEAKGIDWDKKESLEILRIQFDRENADIDPKIREKLWKREIAAKYSIKDDLTQEELESDDYRIAQELLKRDANKVRESFKENQKKYQAPERKEEPSQKFNPAEYKQQLLQDKDVQTFVKNKLLPLGVKDGSGLTIGFEPKNPDQIIEMMVNDRNFWGVFIDSKTGKVDRAKLAKVYAYAQDPDFMEQSLVNLGKNLHLEERLKEDKQIDDRLSRKTGGAPPKESFAKGFLSAALKQKRN